MSDPSDKPHGPADGLPSSSSSPRRSPACWSHCSSASALFTLVARHRSKDVVLYRQGGINFIVNRRPKGGRLLRRRARPERLRAGLPRQDSHRAYARAGARRAQPVDIPTGLMELRLPAIKGHRRRAAIPDRPIRGRQVDLRHRLRFLDGVAAGRRGHGLRLIDHLTHNVYRGRMAYWAFHEHLFNFREIRYFDIQGEYTGLTSKAMTAPDGLIRIPLQRGGAPGGGQIEFLMQFNGEGIQHVALLCDDLIASVDALQMAGVPPMTAPNDIYYEMLAERLPGHGRPVEGAADARHPARRLHRRRHAAPAAADLQPAAARPGLLRVHQRKRDEGLRRGSFRRCSRSMGAIRCGAAARWCARR